MAGDEIPASLNWEVRPADADTPAGSVRFELSFRTPNHSSSMGMAMELTRLDGLSAAQLAAQGQKVAFVLRRDAGEFRCDGVAGQGAGVGTCVYAAHADFADGLRQRGVSGRPDERQQFQMAMFDMGYAYLDELKRQGYATPSSDDLLRAATHGAGLKTLKAMDAAGYRFSDVASLVHARDHGVSPRFLQALADAGYKGLAAQDLVAMRDHGVSASYIAELRDLGYAHLGVEDLVRLRDHGVGVGFVAELHAAGYDGLSAQELARLRDHGVSAGFVRTANASGRKLTPDELIRLRDRGEWQ
jgi:hypothetical protein